jgi:hypothetical protein
VHRPKLIGPVELFFFISGFIYCKIPTNNSIN